MKSTTLVSQWISFVLLYTLAEAEDLSCLCNQFSTAGCARINSTSNWGVCTSARGQGLCIATWEKLIVDNSTVVQYSCSDSQLLFYRCIPNGSQTSPPYRMVTACCQTNFCNTPDYLGAVLAKLFPVPTPTYAATVSTVPGSPLNATGTAEVIAAASTNLTANLVTESQADNVTTGTIGPPSLSPMTNSTTVLEPTPSTSSFVTMPTTPTLPGLQSSSIVNPLPTGLQSSSIVNPLPTGLQSSSIVNPLPTNTNAVPTTNKLTCLCNQFLSPPGVCVKKNSTWGECVPQGAMPMCIATWEILVNTSSITIRYNCNEDFYLPYRCLPQGYSAQKLDTRYPKIEACCTTNYCNTPNVLQSILKKVFPVSTLQASPTVLNPSRPAASVALPPYVVPLMACLSVTIIVVIVILTTFVALSLCPKLLLLSHKTADIGSTPNKRSSSMADSGSCGEQSCDLAEDSGSGSGMPLLSQQSIAAQIVLQELIGKGRFGEVWKGTYKGDSVAVKIFHTREELSWSHEVDLYQTCLLRHPNILRYVASDNKDMGIQMQLWLITEFCEHGSLYDYLQMHTLDEAGVLQLCYTAVSGLNHLHSEIVGSEGKPAIAHRDLKSRNILVKSDLTCCIADLGLGLRYDRVKDSVEELPSKRVGTRRYLSPEVITETIGTNNFESFKRADMYSFGLVMWEIARRGICGGVAEEAQLPYFESLPPDPTLDDMQRVVVVEKRRPCIPNTWSQSQIFSTLSLVIQECWSDMSQARPTALRVKKSLANLQACIKGGKTIEANNA